MVRDEDDTPTIPRSARAWLVYRAQQISEWTWARPLAKSVATTALVVGLAWLGDHSAMVAAQSHSTNDSGTTGASLWPVIQHTHTKRFWKKRKHHSRRTKRSSTAQRTQRAKSTRLSTKPQEGPPQGVLPDGRVVLNVASAEQLCQLPGVGPSRAKRIIALRTKLRRFHSLRQLTRVRGIGYRTVRKLSNHLVLDPPNSALKTARSSASVPPETRKQTRANLGKSR